LHIFTEKKEGVLLIRKGKMETLARIILIGMSIISFLTLVYFRGKEWYKGAPIEAAWEDPQENRKERPQENESWSGPLDESKFRNRVKKWIINLF
jgi:hypothetical protein